MSSFFQQRQSAEPPKDTGAWRICCVSPSRSIVEQLTPALMRCFPGASVTNVRQYGPLPVIEKEFSGQIPDVCFVDVISDRNQALALIPQIKEIDHRINVLALLAASEPELILKCLRLGAVEFLMQPFTAEQLTAALPKVVKTEPEQKSAAKLYCVMPAKGACGASTVASNLAFQSKRLGSKRVLLADMDPLTATLSFILKLKSAYSFIDVLNRADTLDDDLWRAMVVSCGGIDVLLGPELLMQGINEVRDASPVLNFARKRYDTIILDAGSAYGEWNLSQARASDEVLLVTTNELPSVHGAQRSMAYLEANQIPRWKLRLVINRYDKSIGLDKEAVSSALHTDVLCAIPSDYGTVQQALIEGKPIPANSALGKNFALLADKLAGKEDQPAPPRSAPFGGFLSLFSRSSG